MDKQKTTPNDVTANEEQGPTEKPAPVQFWTGVTLGAATQSLITGGAIIAGAPDRLWVPAFIAVGTMLCGHAFSLAERRRACRKSMNTDMSPK